VALTRAQLLAGDGGQGFVLPGQVQGVSQGAGVLIAPNGQISVDASTVTGLVKLNNPLGYNSYVWPDVKGANGTFLSTDAAGVLSWRAPAGLAVVTVSPTQPAPVDVGELWYDCTTGYLKVYQNCVDPQGWTNVAQPGLPVEPLNTSALPGFVRGLGTSGDPYECTVATVASGSSLFIVNSVTVTGLAPNQYVPIIDLNAFTNGGRFHFSNYYANASGILRFQTIFVDQPPSLSGTNYTALIQVGYSTAYIEAFVNIINPLVLLTPGTISGQPRISNTLSYVQGTATGGVTPLNYTWDWEDDLGNTLQSGGPSYIVQPTDLGRTIFVRLTVNDSAIPANSVSGTTNSLGPVVYNPIPSTDWSPTPTDGMDTIPGGQSGTYSGPGTVATSTGCILLSVNGAPYDQGPQALTSGATLAIEWSLSSTCGGAPSGTVLNGTLSDGINTNEYTITVDRLPASFGFNALTDVQPSSQHVSSTASITNINTTAYVTLAATNTAPAPVELSKDGGTTWFTVPAAPSTLLTVNNGDNIQLKFTTGSTLGQLYIAAINIGDGDTVKFTTSSPAFRVTNAINPIFPNTVFSPTSGPNAAPVTTNLPAQSLFGKATATWADGSTNLTSTGALLFQVNGSGYAQTGVAVGNGNTVDICWNLTQVNAAANGATLTGSLTNGVNANSYNLFIDRNTDGYDFSNLTNQLLNTPVVSNTVNPVGFNVPVQLTYAVGTPDTLTTVLANIQFGGFNPVPTAGTGLYVNPGQNIQLKATTGVAYTTPYSITTTLGAGASANDIWTVTTGSTAPLVVTPSIFSPNNGAAGVATTVSVVGTAYNAQNGAGTQASSDWQIYQALGVQPKTSAILSISPGPTATQAPYSSSLPGTPIESYQTGQVGAPYNPNVYQTYYSAPATGSSQYTRLAFNGNTATNYFSRVFTGTTPASTPPAGWFPLLPIPFSTSVEVWGTGTVRAVVDGVAQAYFTLTPGAWNIIDIGSGNLNGIEWQGASNAYISYADISLNAVRIDGTILTDASLGQSRYNESLPGTPIKSYQISTIGAPYDPNAYQAFYTTPSTGNSSGTRLAFDGSTSTNYTARVFTNGGNLPAPAAAYLGWYPTLPIPFTTSVEVWGGGTIRTVVNGVPGPNFVLTAGTWNTINIGSGNLTGIEWAGTTVAFPTFAPSRYAQYTEIDLNAVRIDGTILDVTTQGEGLYSEALPGTPIQSRQVGIVGAPYNPEIQQTYYNYISGNSSGARVAFDGNTSTNYTSKVITGTTPASVPPSGWYPTLPIPFTTSVEVWGSGTIRTVVNGVPGANYLLTAGTWNVLNIGAGTLNGIEWIGSSNAFVTWVDISLNAIRVDGVILSDIGQNPTNVLTLTNNTNLSNFTIGDTVREINAGGGLGDAQGTITAINSATPSITVATTSGTWTIGSSIEDLTAPPVDPGPPTSYPPPVSSYTQIVDVTGDTVNLTSYPLTGLANNTIFYARVQYNSNLIVTSSGFSNWSKFTTV